MKVALALATVVVGQPLYGAPAQFGPAYGGPIGGPVYGGPFGPSPIYGGPIQGIPQAGPAPASSGPSNFDINQQVLNVRAERYLAEGNRAVLSVGPFGSFGAGVAATKKAQGINILIRRNRQAQNQLLATGTGTVEEQNQLDDLRLQYDSLRNQYKRRRSDALSGFLPFNAVYEGKSHEAQLQLARNARDDAEKEMATNPSQENWLKLKAARDAIEEQQQWRDANRADVAGFFSPVGIIGPIKRWQASETALDSAERDWRYARDKFASDPSEDNWWDLRLLDLKLQALEADIGANQGETIAKVGAFGSLGFNFFVGLYHQAGQFDEEEQLWRRYHRLTLQNLERKRAQAQSGANPTQQQLLALDSYGGPRTQQV
jgi:hypothetical protein